MVNQSNMNLLFVLGVLIPALVTVGLFVVFCYCWHRIRIRNEILYKKHDPHKIKLLTEMGKKYEPPLSPPPPFTSHMFLPELFTRNSDNKHAENNYEESPEPTENLDNPDIYRTNNDLNRIQCTVENSCVHVARHNSDIRPNSQASEDSDDSGFRSSRSGQYPHSVSGNSGNVQDNYASNSLHTLQEHDPVRLFKPLKIHPNENRHQKPALLIHSNSSKHKNTRERMVIPTSQNYRNWPTNSHFNDVNNTNAVSSSHQQMSQVQTGYVAPSSGRSCDTMQQYLCMSINNVNGDRLYGIDSPIGSSSSAGYFGILSCNDYCREKRDCSCINRYHSDRLFSEPRSTGYDSAINSIENTNSPANGNHGDGHTKTDVFYPLSYNSQKSVRGHSLMKSLIPGYSISSSTHIPPIHSHLGLNEHGAPFPTTAFPSQQLTGRQLIFDKSYIDELGEISLYFSV